MIRLYLTPIPEQTTDSATDRIGADVQQAGLLEAGGTSVQNVATENVDFQKAGRIQYGPTLSRKVAEELDSLSESAYTTLPLYDASEDTLARKRGYYEVARVEVNPAQESRDDAYQYDVQLTKSGTREDSRRAVETHVGAIDSVFGDADATPSVAIPESATDVRWFDDAEGTEAATATDTVQAEYGTVALYDPTSASTTDPTLTYDVDFADDGPTDVRVYDSRDRVKFAATASGADVNTWVHAYHTGYQFDGAAVIDTGRFRLALGGDTQLVSDDTLQEALTVSDGETVTVGTEETRTDGTLTVESGGTFSVESGGTHVLTGEGSLDGFAAAEYDADSDEWAGVALDATTDWVLAAWSLTRIRPARTQLQTAWSDGDTEARLNATLERGSDGVVWWTPENADAPPSGLADVLEPTARKTDDVARPTQSLIERSKLEE